MKIINPTKFNRRHKTESQDTRTTSKRKCPDWPHSFGIKNQKLTKPAKMTIILIVIGLVLQCSCHGQKKNQEKVPLQYEKKIEMLSDAQIPCPDNNHPHLIDLGLPSGTKWACCNFDAEKPTDSGGYVAWGETAEKVEYNDVTYSYCNGDDPNNNGWYDENIQWTCIGTNISGTKYDIAHMMWGKEWQMPTYGHFLELIDNCTCKWISPNNTEGLLLVSKSNGNTLFFPASGCRLGSDAPDNTGANGSWGGYWSGTRHPYDKYFAYYLYICNPDSKLEHDNMWGLVMGLSIRPVSVP